MTTDNKNTALADTVPSPETTGEDRKLARELGLLDVFSIGTGAMIAGLFIMPGLAYAIGGPASLIAFFIAGLLAAAGMLSEAELASAMPKAGGAYFYVTRSIGPAVGTVYGISTWISISLKGSFFLAMSAHFAITLAGSENAVLIKSTAAGIGLLLVALNILGAKKAGRIQVFLFFGILIVLLAYVIKGVSDIDVHRFDQFMPGGFKSLAVTTGFVFIAYAGILKVGSIAEEVKNPGRVIPLAKIFSLIAVMLLYVAVVFVSEGVLEPHEFNGALDPLTRGGRAVFGNTGAWIMGVAAVLALLSAANAGVMSAARYLLAAGRDKLLPSFFGEVNQRFGSPHVALILTGLVMIGAVFLPVKVLVKAASAIFLISYILSCLSMIILRESHLQNYQPQFKAPLYPFIQIIGFVGYIVLLVAMGKDILILCLAFIVSGLFVYWFYGRLQETREYALLHLIERLTSRDHLTEHALETELKEIIRERDEMTHDRFDHLIEDCEVMDLDRHMEMEEFFRLIAEKLAPELNITPEELKQKLLERESLSSTAIGPEVAIPHIVLEGEGQFSIMIVRCQKGIDFGEQARNVNAIFVLVSTWDERNFHLRALTAIAQIVQDSHFEKKWVKAKNSQVLRDIILLGERRRHHH